MLHRQAHCHCQWVPVETTGTGAEESIAMFQASPSASDAEGPLCVPRRITDAPPVPYRVIYSVPKRVIGNTYELYERKITNQQLFAALASIPDKQAMRIYSHFFQGMSKSAIAEAEGISRMAVCSSIMRGLLALEKN